MKKIIITISCCLLTISFMSQENKGAQIVTTSQTVQNSEVTINGNPSSKIQLQVGSIFERNIIPEDNKQYAFNSIFRFPWDILYIYDTFSEEPDSFDVSKGYFGDKILISWEIKNNLDNINLLKIYRRKYTGNVNENWTFLGSVSKNENSYEDLYVDGGVLYEYKVEADGLEGNEELQKYITGVGFRSPTAVVTGNISFEGGSGVRDVNVLATSNTNNNPTGSSILIDGNSFVDIERINNLENIFTLQTWVKPFERQNQPQDYPIRLFNLNNTHKEINVTVKVDQTNIEGLVVEVNNSVLVLENYFPTGNIDNKGDDIMLPIDSFFDVFTHFSIVIKNENLPKLFINGREINADFITKIQNIEKTENDEKINPYKSIGFSDFDRNIDLTNPDDHFYDIKFGGTTKAIFDEVRIWNAELLEEEIRTDFKRYISGNDSRLISYLAINERLGEYLYDHSKDGFKFNKNHAKFGSLSVDNDYEITWLEGPNNSPSTSKINTDSSGPYQLGVLGVTDEFGNYEISAIPYTGNGESFKITPLYGLHKFEPNQKLVYLGKESSVVNEINFTDKSSFQFKGQVLYDTRGVFKPFPDAIQTTSINSDGYNQYKDQDNKPYPMGTYWFNNGELYEYASIPLEGANIYIDGQIVMGNNNLPKETDSEGKFTINVPIGNHAIEVKKLGHSFLHNGRYPKASENEDDNYYEFFEDREDVVTFIDNTRITLVGRVVGGAVQAEKVIGFSGFLEQNEEETTKNKTFSNEEGVFVDLNGNEINGIYKKTYENSEGIEIEEIISSINNIGQASITLTYANSTPSDETRFTFKTNKESGEYRVQVLPLNYKILNDNVNIVKNSDNISIGPTDNNILNLNYSVVPITMITPEYESENIAKITGEPYHFTQSFNYRATPELSVISQDSDTTIKIGDEIFLTKGFDYPIYTQLSTYEIHLETFEKYINYDGTEPVEYTVPVIDGELIRDNNLALEGTETYTKLPNSNISIYSFRAGIPSLNTNGDNPFTKSINLKYRVNGEDYDPIGLKNLGIILGGTPDGTRTFVTAAPDIPDIILRDPPGSNSFASIESGQSISLTTNHEFNNSGGASQNLFVELGSVFGIGGGLAGPKVDAKVTNNSEGTISATYSANNTDGLTKTYSFNQTISTSDDPDWVGSDADLYIGNSLNYFYGSYDRLYFSENENENEFNLKLENELGEVLYLNKTKAFQMSPEPSNTFFVYSQRYILNELIPEYYNIIDAINAPNSTLIPGEDGVLKIEQYEEQIRLWKELILKNELDKFIATNPDLLEKKIELIKMIPDSLTNQLNSILENDLIGNAKLKDELKAKLNESDKIADLINSNFKNNISFDAGVGEITKSFETTTITVSSTTFNLTLDESLKLQLGGEINDRGIISTTETFFQQDITNSLSEEDTKTTIFSYTLKDNDPNNLFSVDIINFFGKYGSIFSTQGGKSSCPYEGSELSQFFTKAQFNEYFKNYSDEIKILEKEATKRVLEYDIISGIGGSLVKDEISELNSEIKELKKLREQDFQNLISNFNLDNSPKAELSYATQKIEDPIISVEVKDVINIPESENAIFKLTFSNNGATDEALNFRLRLDNNINSAITNIEANGTIVSVPKEGTSFTMSLAKLPSSGINEYKDIKVILESLCDENISSSVTVSATFVPSCTNVVVASPANNWLFNKGASINTDGSSKPLNIKLNGFNNSFNSFNRIELKFKSVTSPNPETLHTFYKNQDDYDTAITQGSNTSLVSLIGDRTELTYPFYIKDRPDLTDGDYEIYAVSYCTNKTEKSSEILKGRIDLNAPEKFGTPLPIDGILGVGEDLRVRFNENISYDPSLSKIEITGKTNQSAIDNSVSLYFNGVGNNVVIKKPRIVSGDFSFQFWMKNETTDDQASIFNQEEGLNISLINGELNATLGANTTKGTIKNDNLFHHYTVSYESDSGKLYIYEDDKNIAITNGEVNTQFTNDKTLVIGGSSFIGNIHDLRIWSKFLSKEDAYANIYTKYIGNENDLLGYWLMDEGRGDLAYDLAFFKHAEVNTSWDIKPKGNSYEFNNEQYLQLDSLSNVSLTENMDATISFWVKTNSQKEATLFSNGRGDGTDVNQPSGFSEKWAINITNNGLLSFESEGQYYPLTSSSIADDQWHHVALVLNRTGSLNTYIDANQVSSNVTSTIKGFSGTVAWLGARGHRDGGNVETVDRKFSGKIDEFRLWNSARTIEQINRDRFNEVDPQSIGLMLYLRFNEPIPTTGKGPRYWYTGTGDANLDGHATIKDGNVNYSNDAPAIKPARNVIQFDVNYVINGDELIIEPSISDWAVLEGQILDITVHRMFDSANNRQESPITWTAYVQKNEVDWFVEDHIHVVDIIKYKDEDKTFEITLVNNGGTTEQFSILNSPNWLHLDVSSGVISPDSKRIITATIDKELAAHVYNETLYLETDYGHNQKLPLNLRVLEPEPNWSVNPNDFTSSSNIIGRIKVDGIFSDDKYDRIGVFYNDEVRGVANLEYDDSYKQYYVYLTIYSNVGKVDDSGSDGTENLTFKIWDASEGKVLESTIDGVLTTPYILNDIKGNLVNPTLFENTSSIEQEISFNKGWSWISFNVNDDNFANINELTKNMSLTTNDRIISTAPVKTETFTENFGWDGTITNSGGLSADTMYKVYLDIEQSLKIQGSSIDVNSWSFSIAKDWNWLPFTLPSNTLLNDALANYQASTNDVIKSQNLFAIYDVNNGWIGSLNYLEDGKGYMLYSSIEQDFNYPSSYAKTSFKGKPQESIAPEFSKYSSTMNAIVLLPEEYDELLVLNSKNEIRGQSKTKQYGNKQLSFITIYGEGKDDLEFYLKSKNTLKPSTKKFSFNKNTLLGTFKEPIDLTENKFNFRVSPNPFKNELSISIIAKEDEVSRIILFSITGQQVYKKDFNLNKGNNSLTINPEISDGVYLLHYISNNETIIKKIMKE